MLGIFKRHPGVAALTMGRVPFGSSMLADSEYLNLSAIAGRPLAPIQLARSVLREVIDLVTVGRFAALSRERVSASGARSTTSLDPCCRLRAGRNYNVGPLP